MPAFVGKIGSVQSPEAVRRLACALPRGNDFDPLLELRRTGCHIISTSLPGNFSALEEELPFVLINGEVDGASCFTISNSDFDIWPDNVPSSAKKLFSAVVVGSGNRPRVRLLRDRFGSKPLYFVFFESDFYFATALPPLLAISSSLRRPDDAVCSSFATFGCNVLEGRSPFSAIHSVPAGAVIEVESGGNIIKKSSPYRLAVPESGKGLRLNDKELDEALRPLLSDAVLHLRTADKNIRSGLFFSGGLDSTILLALNGIKDSNFLLLTQGASPNEKNDARMTDDFAMALEFATSHELFLQQCLLTPEQLERDIVDYIWHAALPMYSGSFDLLGGVAFHSLCRQASAMVDRIYCGEGADELFMGYNRHHIDIEALRLSLLSDKNNLHPELQEWMDTQGVCDSPQHTATTLRRIMLTFGLSEYHFPSVEASAAAFNLKVRTPYIHEPLWDFVVALDDSMFIDRLASPPWTKLPLRRLLRNLFPIDDKSVAKISTRRKRAMSEAANFVVSSLVHTHCGALADLDNFADLIRKVYYKIHINPGFSSRPNLSLKELLR